MPEQFPNWGSPDITLGGYGDYDTPMLPGFEPDISRQEWHRGYSRPCYGFVVPERKSGGQAWVGKKSGAGWREIAVSIDEPSSWEVSIFVLRVLDAAKTRDTVVRAIQRAYYLRATTGREAA